MLSYSGQRLTGRTRTPAPNYMCGMLASYCLSLATMLWFLKTLETCNLKGNTRNTRLAAPTIECNMNSLNRVVRCVPILYSCSNAGCSDFGSTISTVPPSVQTPQLPPASLGSRIASFPSGSTSGRYQDDTRRAVDGM